MGRIHPQIELENPIIFPEISVIRMKTSTNKLPGVQAKTARWSQVGIHRALKIIICIKTPCRHLSQVMGQAWALQI